LRYFDRFSLDCWILLSINDRVSTRVKSVRLISGLDEVLWTEVPDTDASPKEDAYKIVLSEVFKEFTR
jgi:hypothetical protein